MTIPEIMTEVEDIHAALCDALELIRKDKPNARDLMEAATILKGARDGAADLIQTYENEGV